MPIEVYTGKPGNGKTALMMERLMAEAQKGERPIFAGGIDGLEPGLATVLDDPREWNAKNDDGTYKVPNGALIFIDEAWKWFGHLHDASRQATPPHVLALAEHRHRGIDFVWTTQGPNQLYPFTRNLIADHYHCVRRFGTAMIDVFTTTSCKPLLSDARRLTGGQCCWVARSYDVALVLLRLSQPTGMDGAMRHGIMLVAALMCGSASAQVVNKCIGKGGAVHYYSGPCPAGYEQKRTWDATPEPPPSNAELWRRYYQRKQGEADSRYLSQLAGTSTRTATGHRVRVDGARSSLACDSAKAARESALAAVGLSRTYELLQQLDDNVREACK